MWVIPEDVFLSKAISAMRPSGCRTKKHLARVLKEAYPDEHTRQLVAESAAIRLDRKPESMSFLENLGKGAGHTPLAALIWYDLHCSEPLISLAEAVDHTAFNGKTFEEAFHVECARYLRDAERWYLVADARVHATQPLLWNFDLVGRQPSGNDLAAFLDLSLLTQSIDGDRYGFNTVWIVPELTGVRAAVEISDLYAAPQQIGPNVALHLEGSGRYARRWVATSPDGNPLEGSFSAEVAVMTITPNKGPFQFTAAMIVHTADITDASGNREPRDAKDAFVQALYAKHVGARDPHGFIPLFEVRYSVER